jgi:hypothetical protein
MQYMKSHIDSASYMHSAYYMPITPVYHESICIDIYIIYMYLKTDLRKKSKNHVLRQIVHKFFQCCVSSIHRP